MRMIIASCIVCLAMGCNRDQDTSPSEQTPAAPVAETAPAPEQPSTPPPQATKAAAPSEPAAEPALELPEDRTSAKTDFVSICNVFGELMGDGYGNQDVINGLAPLKLSTDWGKAYRERLNKRGESAIDGVGQTEFLGYAKALEAHTDSNCKITIEVLQSL